MSKGRLRETLTINSDVLMHFPRWTLIGVTSAGFGCAVDKQPGIYHKVSSTSN